jgi:hypothetical protein
LINTNAFQGQLICKDILKISNHIEDSDYIREIDHEFNGVNHSLTIETKETQLILSFETCPYTSTTRLGNGFSSLIIYESKIMNICLLILFKAQLD